MSFSVESIYAKLHYPIVGQYKGKSAQRMAIYNNDAFLMSDGGRCRMYNLKTRKVTKEFMLASADKDNHVNNVCLHKKMSQDETLPLLYIPECKKQYRCFVEDVSGESSHLIQTIRADKNGKTSAVLIWITDPEHGFLYSVTQSNKKVDSEGAVANTITKYCLPKINEGKEILLTEKDALNRFVLHFPNILQGAKIKECYLYIVADLQETLNSRQDSKRAVKVIDLKAKKIKRRLILRMLQ